MSSFSVQEAVEYVQAELAKAANPEKAAGMQWYMKSEMPFYGVQKPGQTPIIRHVVKTWPPETRKQYEELALALWRLPHREERYIAQRVAARHRQFLVPASMPLYRRFIVEGAWWDFVDEAATHMVREVVIDYPEQAWRKVDTWIAHKNMWLRRAAIICQVGAKEKTDVDRLFSFCEQRAHEKEFFIRKAIGWALREYSKTDPEAVAGFVKDHEDQLSRLSYREGTKHIGNLLD